jgi:hypothetical protein
MRQAARCEQVSFCTSSCATARRWFSKRHDEIDQKTRELLEREPEKAEGNLAAIRENIAHKERARKIRDIGLEKLQAIWDGQMTSPEKRIASPSYRQAVGRCRCGRKCGRNVRGMGQGTFI